MCSTLLPVNVAPSMQGKSGVKAPISVTEAVSWDLTDVRNALGTNCVHLSNFLQM
jgi:hypothetical protein